jgi:hypothetical protein
MTTKKLTQGPTEADLEAEVHGAIRKVFPWLPAGALMHQVRFSFTVGRVRLTIDGAATAAEGRTDVLVQAHGKPLAVLELKRHGVSLTPDDKAQGLSYANVMKPRFPLLILTNGDETQLIEAHSGTPWQPTTFSEEEFAKLVAAAGRAATHDLKQAVSTLMGTNPDVWLQAVRATSQFTIDEMSGSWDDPLYPFVRGFILPRKATMAAAAALRKGQRFLLVRAAPLAGKSNLLRELVLRASNMADMAVLFVVADEGRGIIASIADLLATTLAWPITPDEARHWLMRVSRSGGPALVLAVDGIGSNHDAARRELEDLSSPAFGPQLKLVVTADDTTARRLMQHPSARQGTAIGRRVDTRIAFGRLDDDEFKVAADALWDARLALQHGAAMAAELRVPWVIRALGAHYAPGPDDPPDQAPVLPAQLSLELLAHTRRRFTDAELRRKFHGTAHAVLHDATDAALSPHLKLEATATFVVRRSTLLQHLERPDVDDLMAHGFLKPAIHESGDDVLFVRVPELLASEASRALAASLPGRSREDASEAARWLAILASRLPLGDIIAAQAFMDAAQAAGTLPTAIIDALARTPPRQESVARGTRALMHFPGHGIVEVTLEQDGSFTAEIHGTRQKIDADPGDPPTVLHDFHPWLILSHLAGHHIVCGPQNTRLDLELLGLVGSCRHVLRRPDDILRQHGLATHHLPGYGDIVCHTAGIVEPITFSLFNMLSREGPQQGPWIDRALASNSAALLARLDIALRETSKLLDPVAAPWAARLLRSRVEPALTQALRSAPG